MTRPVLLVLLALVAPAAGADAPGLLERYAKEAGVAPTSFSPERGAEFYRAEHRAREGGTVSCATCHTSDPRQPGRTRVGKRIEPLAPAANGERFTDPAKVEKWFRRNCNDVLQRACTAQEKGDFIAWLNQVR